MKKKIIYFCILAIFIAGLFFIGWQVYESKINSKTLKTGNTEKLDVQKIADAIKKVESENPPRIGKSPTDEEINNSPYVKHIRIALNGYLDGTNNGVEKMALSTTEGMNCGLNNFDKAYYQSKFIIYDASDDDYGGVQADIVFINKPDAIFWTMIYRLGGNGDYVLRAFCKNGPPEDQKTEFKTFIEQKIKDAKYSY